MAIPIISRAEARAQGLTQYFTGEPCEYGHVDARRVSTNVCITCSRLYQKEYRVAHRDRYNAMLRASHQRNRAARLARRKIAIDARRDEVNAKWREGYRRNRQKAIEKAKRYFRNNRDKVKERLRQYRAVNKKLLSERHRKWRNANPHKIKAAQAKRRACERTAGGSHVAADIRNIGAMQRWRCANPLCRTSIRKKYHLDHIVPLARGGSNDRRNLQLLCAPCNISKRDKDPIAWLQEGGLLL